MKNTHVDSLSSLSSPSPAEISRRKSMKDLKARMKTLIKKSKESRADIMDQIRRDGDDRSSLISSASTVDTISAFISDETGSSSTSDLISYLGNVNGQISNDSINPRSSLNVKQQQQHSSNSPGNSGSSRRSSVGAPLRDPRLDAAVNAFLSLNTKTKSIRVEVKEGIPGASIDSNSKSTNCGMLPLAPQRDGSYPGDATIVTELSTTSSPTIEVDAAREVCYDSKVDDGNAADVAVFSAVEEGEKNDEHCASDSTCRTERGKSEISATDASTTTATDAPTTTATNASTTTATDAPTTTAADAPTTTATDAPTTTATNASTTTATDAPTTTATNASTTTATDAPFVVSSGLESSTSSRSKLSLDMIVETPETPLATEYMTYSPSQRSSIVDLLEFNSPRNRSKRRHARASRSRSSSISSSIDGTNSPGSSFSPRHRPTSRRNRAEENSTTTCTSPLSPRKHGQHNVDNNPVSPHHYNTQRRSQVVVNMNHQGTHPISPTSSGRIPCSYCDETHTKICVNASLSNLHTLHDQLETVTGELRASKRKLESTSAVTKTLDLTKTELKSTEIELESTKRELQSTKTEFGATKIELKSAKDRLNAALLSQMSGSADALRNLEMANRHIAKLKATIESMKQERKENLDAVAHYTKGIRSVNDENTLLLKSLEVLQKDFNKLWISFKDTKTRQQTAEWAIAQALKDGSIVMKRPSQTTGLLTKRIMQQRMERAERHLCSPKRGAMTNSSSSIRSKKSQDYMQHAQPPYHGYPEVSASDGIYLDHNGNEVIVDHWLKNNNNNIPKRGERRVRSIATTTPTTNKSQSHGGHGSKTDHSSSKTRGSNRSSSMRPMDRGETNIVEMALAAHPAHYSTRHKRPRSRKQSSSSEVISGRRRYCSNIKRSSNNSNSSSSCCGGSCVGDGGDRQGSRYDLGNNYECDEEGTDDSEIGIVSSLVYRSRKLEPLVGSSKIRHEDGKRRIEDGDVSRSSINHDNDLGVEYSTGGSVSTFTPTELSLCRNITSTLLQHHPTPESMPASVISGAAVVVTEEEEDKERGVVNEDGIYDSNNEWSEDGDILFHSPVFKFKHAGTENHDHILETISSGATNKSTASYPSPVKNGPSSISTNRKKNSSIAFNASGSVEVHTSPSISATSSRSRRGSSNYDEVGMASSKTTPTPKESQAKRSVKSESDKTICEGGNESKNKLRGTDHVIFAGITIPSSPGAISSPSAKAMMILLHLFRKQSKPLKLIFNCYALPLTISSDRIPNNKNNDNHSNSSSKRRLNFEHFLRLARDFDIVPALISRNLLFDLFDQALKRMMQVYAEMLATDDEVGFLHAIGPTTSVFGGRNENAVSITYDGFLYILCNIAIRESMWHEDVVDAELSSTVTRQGLALLQCMNASNGMHMFNTRRDAQIVKFKLHEVIA